MSKTMIISGLQKLSLLDYPGEVACTVFTGGCNLRCPYCHNSEFLVNPPHFMETEEFFAFLKKKRGLLDGVCITGGEPCLQLDLENFTRTVKEIGFKVKLDTNGFFPERLGRLLDEGLLDYVAMDIKNEPARYAETVGLPAEEAEERGKTVTAVLTDGSGKVTDVMELPGATERSRMTDRVEESLRRLLRSGIDFELRTTLVQPFHDREAMAGIRRWLEPLLKEEGRKVPRYYLQKFVDRETVAFAGMTAPSEEETAACLEEIRALADAARLRGE